MQQSKTFFSFYYPPNCALHAFISIIEIITYILQFCNKKSCILTLLYNFFVNINEEKGHNSCMIIIKVWKMRTDRGISLRELEKKSGISRATINRIENGQKSPTLDELESIAIALGCRISDLYDSNI